MRKVAKVNAKTIQGFLCILVFICIIGTLTITSFWKEGRLLPSWVVWENTKMSCDLDGDGNAETIQLANRTLRISASDGTIYSTPAEWKVSCICVANVDNTDTPEIVMLAWKQGSYGTSHPFWEKEDSQKFSQHLYFFNYQDSELRPRWMSSALEAHITNLTIDQENLLHLTTLGGNESTWIWDYFGIYQLHETYPRAHVSFLAVGDNIAHSSVNEECLIRNTPQPSFNYTALYKNVQKRISSADLAAIQQETILINDPKKYQSFPLFGTPTALGGALAEVGFDIICAASNHSFDQGSEGVNNTLDFWRTQYPDISLLGLHANSLDASGLSLRECNGIKFALFNYTYGLNGLSLPDTQGYLVDTLQDKNQLVADIRKAEDYADFSLCFLHIGEEYASVPTESQIELATQLIEAGADCIICTHPHVVQSAQRIDAENGNTGIVFWSLGNFMSHQIEARTALGGTASIDFYLDSEGKPFIGNWKLVPTVCHRGSNTTRVYFLEDYSEDLANEHLFNTIGEQLSWQGLWEQWNMAISYTR